MGMVTAMDEGAISKCCLEIIVKNISYYISYLIKAIGGIVKKLGDLGMLKKTVFFYATDNGGLIGAGGSNLPFRFFSKSPLYNIRKAIRCLAGCKLS